MEAENIKIKPASENRKLKLIQPDAGRPPAGALPGAVADPFAAFR
jgi:hypothetical protein